MAKIIPTTTTPNTIHSTIAFPAHFCEFTATLFGGGNGTAGKCSRTGSGRRGAGDGAGEAARNMTG